MRTLLHVTSHLNVQEAQEREEFVPIDFTGRVYIADLLWCTRKRSIFATEAIAPNHTHLEE